MKVLMTGATGFVGRAVALRLRRDGHSIAAWVRAPGSARHVLSADVELIDAAGGDARLRAAVSEAEAVVNLAGEPVLPRRWTEARKAALVSSRVGTTTRLVDAMVASRTRPAVLVSASAVGYYGDRGEESMDEISSPGRGFLSSLCQQWETAALRARDHGVRVAVLRIGVVLGLDGGALAQMLPAFRLGLGGPIGTGEQRLPWIHVRDLVEIVARAVSDAHFTGPINATAERSVRADDFARALGAALGRPAFLPIPTALLRLFLGEGAEALLQGARVDPRRLRELGFEHRHPSLENALTDLLTPDPNIHIGPARDLPESSYVQQRAPSHVLETADVVSAPLSEVFSFFSNPQNLGALSPAGLSFEIRTPLPIEMKEGAIIDYRIRLGPIPMKWRTRIERFVALRGFADSQQAGPYRCWWHEHDFREVEGGVEVRDRVWHAISFDPFGLVNRWFVAPRLRAIFSHRRRALELRFGRPLPPEGGPRYHLRPTT